MSSIVISINREILPSHTDDEFQKWVQYEFNNSGKLRLSNNNPLFGLDISDFSTVKEIDLDDK